MSKEINDQLKEFGLRIEILPVLSLQPYEGNPRFHSSRSIESIQNSVDAFGFKSVVLVDNEMNVIAGHGRIKAAEKAGLEKLPVLIATDLDEIKGKALRIADNRTTDLSEWDEISLGRELDELLDEIDLEITGFTEDELEELLNQSEVEPPDEFKEYDEGLETQYQCPKCGYEWSGQSKPAE